mmetsp:Transcript_116309/g.189440  ORF Transcript_116309/g.189440 Transcript_116309/m.189440 type:complete len:269 (-) Transcript_116309:284-1090(-)
MYSSAARLLARRVPLAVAAAGGASLVMPAQFMPRQMLQCDEAPKRTASTRLPRTTSGLNPKKPTVIEMKTGLKFLDLFKAEYKDESTGEVAMDKQVDLHAVSILLEGAGGKKKQAKEMFNVMDADHHGYITYANIIAYFLNHAEGTHNDKMAFLFHACDVDFSNKIEPHELKSVVYNMMQMKMASDGKLSFFQWHPVMYADIPERFVLHLKANEFVNDVFSKAHSHHGGDVQDHEELSQKEFIAWHARGGKQAKRLDALFSIDHMSHH